MNCKKMVYPRKKLRDIWQKINLSLFFITNMIKYVSKMFGKVLAYFFACIHSMSQQQARIKSDSEYKIDCFYVNCT